MFSFALNNMTTNFPLNGTTGTKNDRKDNGVGKKALYFTRHSK